MPIPREYAPYPDGVLKLPPLAQAIADMTMQEYAVWVVRGITTPALEAVAAQGAREPGPVGPA